MSTSDLNLALRLAWRARLPAAALWLIVGLIAFVLLAAGFSARQPATVALDIGISYIRFVVPLLLVLLIQELVGREFERRYFLTSLTYPRRRARWFVGRFAAAMLFAVAAMNVLALLLAALSHFVGTWYQQATPVDLGWPYVVTFALVIVDLTVVGSLAMFISVVARTPVFVLVGCLGFVVIARSYADVIDLLRMGTDALVERLGGAALYRETLPALNFVLPDLGALDVRAITLYGRMDYLPPDLHWHVVGAAMYSIALFAGAVWLLNRREFD